MQVPCVGVRGEPKLNCTHPPSIPCQSREHVEDHLASHSTTVSEQHETQRTSRPCLLSGPV
eukprot:7527572-Pyramimonas_sp.AAC.1